MTCHRASHHCLQLPFAAVVAYMPSTLVKPLLLLLLCACRVCWQAATSLHPQPTGARQHRDSCSRYSSCTCLPCMCTAVRFPGVSAVTHPAVLNPWFCALPAQCAAVAWRSGPAVAKVCTSCTLASVSYFQAHRSTCCRPV